MKVALVVLGVGIVVGAFFLLNGEGVLTFAPDGSVNGSFEKSVESTSTLSISSGVGNSSGTLPKGGVNTTSTLKNQDIEKQLPLTSSPLEIKAIYATNWTAGSPQRIKRLIDFVDKTELNAIVIDIKDYSGFLGYRTGIADAKAIGAEKDIRILRPNALIKELHDHGIYVIGRIAVFEDSLLANARPGWALQNKVTGGIWKDHKGLAWLDPSVSDVWDYNIAITKDALSRGFDEINFDYIRFASDGDLANIGYPGWDQKTSKATVIKKFFKYLRENLPGAKISADFFGLTTINYDDLGIGQVLESAYQYFDFVAPMVYPSHYAPGFLGYKSPANFPYEVVKYSLENAVKRLKNYGIPRVSNASSTASSTDANATSAVLSENIPKTNAKLRPWLQDFNLGATYDAPMVRKQIQATYDSATGTPHLMNGWMLWNPSNEYTAGALDLQTPSSSHD
ncbi:MAG: putative glycoside hydrolase [Patescibacteria group bacterium]